MSYDGSRRMTRIVATAGSGANPFPWPKGSTNVTCDGNGNVTQLWGRNIDNGTIWKVEQEFDYEQRLTAVNRALYPELGRAVTGWFRLTHLNGAGGAGGGAGGSGVGGVRCIGGQLAESQASCRQKACTLGICCSECFSGIQDCGDYRLRNCPPEEGLLGVPVAFGKCCRGGAPGDGGCRKPCGCNVGCQRSGRIDYEGGQAGPPFLVVSCPGWGCGGYVNAPPGFPPAEDCWREFQERCPQARGCPMPCAAAPPPPPPSPPAPPPAAPPVESVFDRIYCGLAMGFWGAWAAAYLPRHPGDDKYVHCRVSCEVYKICGAMLTLGAGIAWEEFESKDACELYKRHCGDRPSGLRWPAWVCKKLKEMCESGFDIFDVIADIEGIRCGQDGRSCEDCCRDKYPAPQKR
jgi:hypothetical protein